MKRRTLVRVSGIAVSLACLLYIAVQASRVWDDTAPALLQGEAVARIGLALVPSTLGYIAAAFAWLALLSSFGVRAAVLPGIGAYLAAQPGKYLPGNVGHYVGRVVLGTRVGHPAATVSLAMTVEFALLLAIACVLSLPLLGLMVTRLSAAWNAPLATIFMGLAVCVAAISIALLVITRVRPTLLHTLKHWVLQLRMPLSSASAFGYLVLSVCLSVAAIGLTGGSLLIVGGHNQAFALDVLWQVVSVYSVAWMVGALTPGMPGGIGLREVLLVEGLTPLWGGGEAVAGALLFRGVTIAADVIALGLGLAAIRRIPPTATGCEPRRTVGGSLSSGPR